MCCSEKHFESTLALHSRRSSELIGKILMLEDDFTKHLRVNPKLELGEERRREHHPVCIEEVVGGFCFDLFRLIINANQKRRYKLNIYYKPSSP